MVDVDLVSHSGCRSISLAAIPAETFLEIGFFRVGDWAMDNSSVALTSSWERAFQRWGAPWYPDCAS